MDKEIISCPSCGGSVFNIIRKRKKHRSNSLWIAKCAKCKKELGKGFWTIEQVADNLLEFVRHNR